MRTLLRRFRSDERGAFLVIFALLAVVLIATAGAVVDYTMVEQTRNRAQAALDAAALGLQPQIYTQTEAQLRSKAEALVQERLADSGAAISVGRAWTDTGAGQLYLEADLTIPTAFVALVGVSSVPAKIVSEATRRRINIEVAMVLDNSTSMTQQSRMTNLKAAANHAADILFSNQDSQPNVFVGVVPFTEFVNVGTGNRYADWIDQNGTVPMSRLNFDNDDNHATAFTGAANRFALYDTLGVSWRGCVEARPSPYDTNDTAPSIDTPATMFVPAFAPDEPDTQSRFGRDVYGNNYLSDEGGICILSRGRSLPDREAQERMCKYQGASVRYGKEGPNADCPSAALLPLTNQRQSVKARITQMTANGYTNIHQGAIWGLHMLSPTAPLTEARDYDTGTYKVMILMTDGENTYPYSSNMNGAARYTAYNYPVHGRLTGNSEDELKAAMNVKTEATCTEAKRDNRITIFTIGLEPPNTATHDMLVHCATDATKAFFPTDASQLTGIFQTIANQLTNLRLAQ